MAFPDSGRGGKADDLSFAGGASPDRDDPFGAASYETESGHSGELELDEEDVRLPWLEGDDEEFEEPRGAVMGQGLLLALLGVVAIALIVGSLFWMLRGDDGPRVADGGTIEAPDAPYKTRPDDPGGRVVAGTGDTSFAVAEGEARPPQIEAKKEAPAPGFETPAKAEETPPEPAPAATPAARGVGVQVGAYSNRSQAEAGWVTLKGQYPDLAGVDHRIVQGQADIGTVYRLQAVPGDLAAARALCSGMKSAGLSCQVKR